MRVHHAQLHNESLSTVTLTCSKCGDEFERGEYDVVEAENYFCSYECRKTTGEHSCPKDDCDYTSDSELGIKQHHKRSHDESLTVVEFECDWCQDTVERQRSFVDESEHNFCGVDCRVQWVSDNNSGKDHYDYSRKEVTCDNCGGKFERIKHNRERTESNFCSHDCYGESLEGTWTGEDNPRWRGGYEPYYGPDWHEQRRTTIERDNCECQDCGLTREAHYEKYEEDLHVHHIQPFRTFDDAVDANQLDNLTTLCKQCHAEREAEIVAA
jgi:5-methylcytosine-specific restriction endonuclease McrA